MKRQKNPDDDKYVPDAHDVPEEDRFDLIENVPRMPDRYKHLMLIRECNKDKTSCVLQQRDRKKAFMKDTSLYGFTMNEKRKAKREADLLMRFSHPNVCYTIDAFVSKKGRMLVL